MSSKIRVLSDHTINKIAAGEVIENPASVVKELVENSIDAGATDICIEIQGGGRQLIRISDNGCGMNSDDALLCLERHATSKIREVEQIHEITTMGFRGEAVPSIASISKFNILTCPEPTELSNTSPDSGTLVIVEAGKILSCTPAARSQGTTIEVKSLFFNVPVRKKFLKSPAIDANEIHKTLSLISLGYPNIKFNLINDGKSQLTTTSPTSSDFAENLKTRITEVLGADFQQNCTYIDIKDATCHVKGYIGLPSYTRHNRTGQYLFINQRGVVSPAISYAVRDGFGTSLPNGRHPVYILHLTIDGSLVDVNVHPQKREVRLRNEQAIRQLIARGIQNSLRHQPPSHSSDEIISPTISPVFAQTFHNIASETPATTTEWVFRPKPYIAPEPVKTFSYNNQPPTQFTHTQQQFTTTQTHTTNHTFPPKILATISRFILIDTSIPNNFIAKGCPNADRGGLILINQRAAHARIIFEKFQESSSSTPLAQQTLLIPHTLEVSPFETEMLRSNIKTLNKMGISIKEFGANTFLIDAIPQIFGNTNIETLVSDIIHSLRDSNESQPDDSRAKQIAIAASRSAISHDRRLTLDEAQSLLQQLVKCQHPYQCPSGKPIIAQLSTDELAKLFIK